MKILINSKNCNYICTIAIGEKILEEWKKFSFPFLKTYCQKHKIGLILFDKDIIPKSSEFWKKPTWQKLLVPELLKK